MTKRLNRIAAVGVALLSTWSTGCAVDRFSLWKWPEPEVADVHPMRKSRAEAAVVAFDRERNRAQYLAARSSWRQGDYKMCRESLDKILLRDPNHRDSLLLLSDVALETDNPQEAVDTLRRLAAIDPNDTETAYRLGLALEAKGEFKEALPYLRQAAANDPTNTQYSDARDQAEGLVAESESIAADVKVVDDAIQINGNEAVKFEANLTAAIAAWEAGHDADAAAKIVPILAQQPDHVDANILQAEIELAQERTSDAVARMERLAANHPTDAQVFRAFGLLCEATGDADRAVQCFAEAQRLSDTVAGESRDASVTIAEGPVLQAAFDQPVIEIESLTSTDDATLTAPEPPTAAMLEGSADDLLREGQSLLKAKRFAEARKPLRAAIERCDDPKYAVTAAVASLKAEQPELSFELATLGASRFPTSAGLQQVRGMAAYRMRRYTDAEAALRQSLSLDNSQALSYFLLGSALEHLGQPEAGGRYRSEAAQLDSRYALRK